MNEKQRVAVYLRVGGSGDVKAACKKQKEHFTAMLAKNEGCELVGFYPDLGLESRTQPNLERLLADCRAGRVDLVVTKSTSRLSRSFPAVMETVRKLHYSKPPIGVYFEDVDINTLEPNNFLLLSMFEAMLANEDGAKKSMPRTFSAFLKMKKKTSETNTEEDADDE